MDKSTKVSDTVVGISPKFTYTPGRVNAVAFNETKKAIEAYVGMKYHHFKEIFRDGKEYDFKLTEVIESGTLIEREIKEHERKLRIRERAQYNLDKESVYTLLWETCDTALQQQLLQDSKFKEMERDNHVLDLWLGIKAKCIVGYSRSVDPEKLKMDAERRLYNIHQNVGENIGEFYIRFQAELDAFYSSGTYLILRDKDISAEHKVEVDKREERRKALLFLERLDKRLYGSLLDTLNIQLATNVGNYPDTLVEAYQIASTYTVGGKDLSQMKSAPRQKNPKTETALAAKANTGSESSTKNDKSADSKVDLNGLSIEERKKVTECNYCHNIGHWKKECPKRLQDSNEKETSTSDKVILCQFACAGNADGNSLFDANDILIDNQASVSVFMNPSLLTNIRQAEVSVKIYGMGGFISVDQVGDFNEFGEVYYCPTAITNILSLAEVDNKAKVSYVNKCFKVETDNRVIYFERKGNLHIWNTCDSAKVMITTVEENKLQFNHREIGRAEEARDLIVRLGYPSVSDVITMLVNGGIMNSELKARDFANAEKIWGKSIGILKGKTTRKKSNSIFIPKDPESRDVDLSMDIFFIAGIPFLMSISSRMKLYVVTHLTDRKASTVLEAIESHISAYKVKDFYVKNILVDGESAIIALRTEIELMQVMLHPCAKNEHIPDIERAGRVLKERVRAYWNTLPYKINKTILIHMVYHCVKAINVFPKEQSVGSKSPKELYSGDKLDLKEHFKISFGQYCQVHEDDSVTNTMKPRTIGAIALDQDTSIQGSYRFYSLSTGKVIKRKSWTVIPIPLEIIALINEKSIIDGMNPSPQEILRIGTRMINESDSDDDDNISEPDVQVDEILDSESDHESEVSGLESSNLDINVEEDTPHYHTRSWRQRSGNILTCYSVNESMRIYGDEALESIDKELSQMISKEVWRPVEYSEIKSKSQIIGSLIFTKRKKSGVLKSRLVADGRMQDRSTTSDISAPTVATESLFLSAAIDAHEQRYVATVDIEGAFLHASMEKEVFMEVNTTLSNQLLRIHPEYGAYLHKGKLYVKLLKALYGTIEAAKLFYKLIRDKLLADGFIMNHYDTCVFNKTMNGVQVTVVVHVDDLKVSCQDKEAINQFISYLKREFKNIEVHFDESKNPSISYLGMTFTYHDGKVDIRMDDMIEEVLSEMNISAKANTPAKSDLFTIDNGSHPLDQMMSEQFHSVVAKLLYIAKRGRPDILLAVSFLSTRVQSSTQQDMMKLTRVLAYINSTKELCLTIGINDPNQIEVFIDASFAIHSDRKSHSGCVVILGSGGIISKSIKQKLVSKSSTEAELIAVSDQISQIIWIKNFLSDQGYEMKPIIIYQDNQSAITLENKGLTNNNRMKHIEIRYYFIKDLIDQKQVEVTYIPTEHMVADYFTKPLQGKLFNQHRQAIMK